MGIGRRSSGVTSRRFNLWQRARDLPARFRTAGTNPTPAHGFPNNNVRKCCNLRSRESAMSRMFSELIRSSRRISRDEFAANFGGVAEDVIEMLEGEQARRIVG